MADATKTTAHPTGHMTYTQTPAACEKNIIFSLISFHSASEKLLFFLEISFICLFLENAIKDVTNRYASSWMSKTRKLRIDSDWWEDTLQPYKSRNKV